MRSHTFPFVNAKYRTESNPRYAGNDYIEALPALPNDVMLTVALSYLPAFDPEERNLSAPERIQRLDILQTVVAALPRLVRLARAVIKMICTGYGPRKPFSSEDNKTMQELYELQQTGCFASVRQPALAAQNSMALIGASGCGKSYGLRHIAGLFPQAIYHKKLGKWQLPCIFIEMAYDGESVHTLASELFAELDRLLPDAGYTGLYMERKGLNAQQRLAKALAISYEHGAGMIFVDESQNQKSIGNDPTRRERKSASANAPKSETPLTKLLITASNTSHIPLLMSGTLEMQALLGGRFTRARRMAGHGSAVWMPLERSRNLSQPGEFEQLLKALWRYQWIRKPVELTPEWVEIFFLHTQGIPDIMVKLFESAQEAAIASKLETLTPELVATVFRKEFVTTAFGIAALRDGDKVLLYAVTDLYQPDPVQAARKTQEQFPLPRTSEIRAKKPPGLAMGVAPSASLAAVPNAAGGPEQAAVQKLLPKPVRPSPTPVSVSIEVADKSDLRKTLTGAPDAPVAEVADLRKAFPL
jgi:energy-coupling factor transporter ATP-binding protein EcfA2